MQTSNKTLVWTYSCLYLGFCDVHMCIGLHGKVLVAGGYRNGFFFEKLMEASPMPGKDNASWLQDDTGQA